MPRLPPLYIYHTVEKWFHSFVVCDSGWFVDHCECVKSLALEEREATVLRMVWAGAPSGAIHWLDTNSLSKRKTEKRKSHLNGLT